MFPCGLHRLLYLVQAEVNHVCKCAAKWDAMRMNYDEWDFSQRDTRKYQKRTKHIRFLLEVCALEWRVPCDGHTIDLFCSKVTGGRVFWSWGGGCGEFYGRTCSSRFLATNGGAVCCRPRTQHHPAPLCWHALPVVATCRATALATTSTR